MNCNYEIKYITIYLKFRLVKTEVWKNTPTVSEMVQLSLSSNSAQAYIKKAGKERQME